MFYNAFLDIMGCLAQHFGYKCAIQIKDSFGYVVGGVFGALVMVWLMADFYLKVDVGDEEEVPPYSAIVRAGAGKKAKYYANPQNLTEVVEVFISYVFIKIFPKHKSLAYKNAKVIH
ncbi:hypothetical protein JCM17380_03620 [Desulfosporosinus burensis]